MPPSTTTGRSSAVLATELIRICTDSGTASVRTLMPMLNTIACQKNARSGARIARNIDASLAE